MVQEKQMALDAIRQLIAYHRASLRETSGYTGNGPLTYITRDKALVALRYGVSIGIRDSYCDYTIEVERDHHVDFERVPEKVADLLNHCPLDRPEIKLE